MRTKSIRKNHTIPQRSCEKTIVNSTMYIHMKLQIFTSVIKNLDEVLPRWHHRVSIYPTMHFSFIFSVS